MSQLEVLGLWWFVVEKMSPDERQRLNRRLLNHRRSLECPFLMDSRCAVYALRPLACRFLHVFGAPCAPEEIPVESRPGDVWLPGREVVRPAIMTMLGYFGFDTEAARKRAFEQGYIAAVSSLMSDFPWESLATARKK